MSDIFRASAYGGPNTKDRKISQLGITLIELLASLILMSIILGSIYNILLHSLNLWHMGDTKTEVSQNARIAIERMSKELRQAKTINRALPTLVKFWADNDWDPDALDGDWNNTIDIGETITYSLVWDVSKNSYNLVRTIDSNPAGEEFGNYIQNQADFNISYWDATGANASGDPPTLMINLIEMALCIYKNYYGEDYRADLRASVHPRNLQ